VPPPNNLTYLGFFLGLRYIRSEVIGVFVKYPDSGKVKTRLARDVGPAVACELYRRMTALVIRNLGDLPFTLFCDPFREEWDYRRYFPGLRIQMQRGEDLGERIFKALTSAPLIIGTDCLDISPAILAEAKSALESSDLVLGPATDGGYYLVGMRKPRREFFEGISWSTDQVMKQTLERAQGVKVHLLPVLSDIDTLEDLKSRAGEKGRRVDGDTVLTDLIV